MAHVRRRLVGDDARWKAYGVDRGHWEGEADTEGARPPRGFLHGRWMHTTVDNRRCWSFGSSGRPSDGRNRAKEGLTDGLWVQFNRMYSNLRRLALGRGEFLHQIHRTDAPQHFPETLV